MCFIRLAASSELTGPLWVKGGQGCCEWGERAAWMLAAVYI